MPVCMNVCVWAYKQKKTTIVRPLELYRQVFKKKGLRRRMSKLMLEVNPRLWPPQPPQTQQRKQ